MTEQNHDSGNTNDFKNLSSMKMAGRCFFGEIRKIKNGDKVLYFVEVSLLAGNDQDEKPKYQYASLYVSKPLQKLFEIAYSSQNQGPDNKWYHTLTGFPAEVEIVAPYFESWEKNGSHGVNGNGVLTSITFGKSS